MFWDRSAKPADLFNRCYFPIGNRELHTSFEFADEV